MNNRPISPAEQREWNDKVLELLNEIRLGVNRTDSRAKEIAEAVDNRLIEVFDTSAGLHNTDAGINATLDDKGSAPVGPVTIETVEEKPLETVETVQEDVPLGGDVTAKVAGKKK